MTTVPLHSLWSATAPPGPARTPLSGAQRCEVAIVGAGYTGLSAALHLLAAGRAVTLVEALEAGGRASGANGGQVIPGVKHDPDALEAMFGAAAGGRLVATVAAGPDLVFELIARHQIACEAVRQGWLQPADSEQALATLGARAAQWQRRGAPVEMVGRAEMAALIGSDCYRGGLLDRRGGTVQPLAYVRGLAAAVLKAGGRLYSDSPVHRLARAGGAWRVETPQGSLTAPAVILATNAYSGTLHPGLRRSVVTVPSFQVATGPLPQGLRRQILPGGQAASDTRRLLRYFRTDAGGRFVLGSRGTFARDVTLHAVRHHYRAAREIYPQLESVPFEYHWGGLVAMTRDSLPHLHELAPGLLAGLGYNGRGVAMATMMGRLLAQRVLGTDTAELGFPVTPLRTVPLHALSGLGVRAMVQYLRLADALARRRHGGS